MADAVRLPQGTTLQWSGQYEYLERAEARLAVVVPLTLLIVFLLIRPTGLLLAREARA